MERVTETGIEVVRGFLSYASARWLEHTRLFGSIIDLNIYSYWKRLVEGGPKGMGKAYKVMAIVPENGGRRRPVGFGGHVVG